VTGDRAGGQSAARALAAAAGAEWPSAAIPGALHVVSTPIGHLGDITLRALAVLQQVAVIACEDTRRARTLLQRYGVTTPTVALHEHNEARTTPRLLERLRSGEAIALVSDAGTPLVSDPGARLVEAAVDAGLAVVPVPGPSAALAALVASGVPAHPCTVLGFLPRKGGDRAGALRLAATLPHAVVLFEAPGRLAETLRDLATVAGGERRAVVARELTKKFEEFRRGTLASLGAYYEETPPRGELVLVLEGLIPDGDGDDEDRLRAIAADRRAEGFRPREIVEHLVDAHGAARNLAYRIAHQT
jgi:16S rRNA (cytidine1402-2'-O)-methyltransferase